MKIFLVISSYDDCCDFWENVEEIFIDEYKALEYEEKLKKENTDGQTSYFIREWEAIE